MEAIKILVDVNVKLDFTERTAALLARVFSLNAQPVAPIAKESPAPVEAGTAEAEPAAAAPVEAEPAAPVVMAPASVEEAKAVAEATNMVDDKPAIVYTEEDVRKAMREARTYFEGEDYKENTSSEKYQKYHKELTKLFKHISALYGAKDQRPSLLPDNEARGKFIKHVAMLELNKTTGEIYCAVNPF